MKQHFIIKNNQTHLLLFFAGWGMDETPFLQIHPTDKDWMICYDYRSLAFDATILQEYSQITLIAWSMGVWAASQIMNQYPHLPVSRSIAINGTLYPIHETKGITPAIFEGTLQGLNEPTLQKFQRRMCGSIADYRAFQSVLPQRPVDELKEELAAIQKQYLSLPPSDFAWQKAIIGKNDRIFLPDNQWLAWRNNVASLEQVEAAHYQHELFNNVIRCSTEASFPSDVSVVFMNKQLIIERFSKAITTYPREASVQRQIADKMIRLLTKHIPSPCSKVIEFGCGTGIYSRMLLQSLRPEELLLNDLCPDMKYCCKDLLKKKQVSFLSGDAETIPFPTESTLITSCSALQWFESPENFFERCNTLLNNQGYFAFSTFGKENMKEIRELTGNGLPYRSREELETALSSHFDIVHSEEELIPLSFEDPIKVLYHLKQTGVNGLSVHPTPAERQENSLSPQKDKPAKQQWTRRDLQLFCERYTQKFNQGTSVSLTYHPIYIIAKKKEK